MRSQPEYTSQYYYNFELSSLTYSIYEQLDHQETLAIITDVNAKHKKGSIGFFIVKSYNDEHFIWFYGPSEGIDPWSFWFETSSLPAIVLQFDCFLDILTIYIIPRNKFRHNFRSTQIVWLWWKMLNERTSNNQILQK